MNESIRHSYSLFHDTVIILVPVPNYFSTIFLQQNVFVCILVFSLLMKGCNMYYSKIRAVRKKRCTDKMLRFLSC
jgi:hypothetical protein